MKHGIDKLSTWRIFRQISQILSTFCGRQGALCEPTATVLLGIVWFGFGMVRPRRDVRIIWFTVLKARRDVLCPWIYCAEVTQRWPCVIWFTVLTRRDVLVSLDLLCWSYGEMSCILGFTMLKLRRDVLVSLGSLCWSHGKICHVSVSPHLWV
jgi:hypothetical protein